MNCLFLQNRKALHNEYTGVRCVSLDEGRKAHMGITRPAHISDSSDGTLARKQDKNILSS